jgi:hypothetical protein
MYALMTSSFSSIHSFFYREIQFTNNFLAGITDRTKLSMDEPIVTVGEAPFNNFTLCDYLLVLRKYYGDVINLKQVNLNHIDNTVCTHSLPLFLFSSLLLLIKMQQLYLTSKVVRDIVAILEKNNFIRSIGTKTYCYTPKGYALIAKCYLSM